jgi:hypothetical protein
MIVGPKAGVVGEHDGKDRGKMGCEKEEKIVLNTAVVGS